MNLRRRESGRLVDYYKVDEESEFWLSMMISVWMSDNLESVKKEAPAA